jgi:hypothetical protein
MHNDTKSDLLGILIITIIFAPISALYAYLTKKKIEFVVQEKGTLTQGSVNNGNGNTYTNFMIYTKDGRALKNVNSFWYWKWRSAELQIKMQKGKKYSAVIYGWRIGAFNVYPNIVSVKEIKGKK